MFPLRVLALLSLPCLLVLAETTAPPGPPILAAETCGFQGDDNTYGLGIRLGLYLQWITTSLADNFVPDEAITLRGVNNCFQLSTFIALLYLTFTRGPELYAVEAYLLLLFCLGGVCSGRGSGNSGDTEERPASFVGYKASTIGVLIQIALGAALVFYAVWFVYIGMDQMAHPPCSRAAFFFAKVDLYHWFRTLQKVLFTMAAVLTGILILVVLWGLVHRVLTRGFVHAAADICGFNEESMSATFEQEGEKVTILRDISFGMELVFFILSTELLIRWNHISGVNSMGSTGQLIPLTVGGTGLVRVLYKIIVKSIRGDYHLAENYSFNLLVFSSTVSR